MQWYIERNIIIEQGIKVAKIDVNNKKLTLDDQRQHSYQTLVLATGSTPRKLEIPGSELAGIHYLKTLADAQRLQQSLRTNQNLVIVGGGYIGLEVAANAQQLGIKVTLLEHSESLLQRVASKPLADYVLEQHRQHSVQINCNANVVGFTANSNDKGHCKDNQVKSVLLADGQKIAADIVLIGIGSLANDTLAASTGIKCQQGVIVDNMMLTSDNNVFAIGDCSRFFSPLYDTQMRLESVQNAQDQAVVAAKAILACQTPDKTKAETDLKLEPYNCVPRFWSDQYSDRIQIAGCTFVATQDVVRGDLSSGDFSVYRLDKHQKIVAIESPNRSKEVAFGARLIAQQAKLDIAKIQDDSISFKKLTL